MNSKERVKAALNGERTDRIPRFIWANDATKENWPNILESVWKKWKHISAMT